MGVKPVANTIVSAGTSLPSEATSDLSLTSSTPWLTRSTLGASSARYQSLDSNIRLQPSG